MNNTYVPPATKIKPGKRFFRFDRLFNDAVRSEQRSAIVNVLLRVQLSADKARRTANKILEDRNLRSQS
jgi:hypothetical protein